jgi:pimeloyl-ACP methyl ester carboxylesterase
VLWGAFRSGYFRRGLTGFSKPLLLAWGREDRIIPRATMDLIAAAAPGARTVIIPGAGHLPQQERPDEVAAVIRDFAARL